MQITYNPNLTRQNADDQTVYFTITDDNAESFEWHADIPQGADVQAYLDAHMEWFYLLILKRLYPGAKPQPAEGETELPAFLRWIEEGHTNVSTVIDPETQEETTVDTVIDKKPWATGHPVPERIIDGKKIGELTKAQFDAAGTLGELKTVLSDILMGRD